MGYLLTTPAIARPDGHQSEYVFVTRPKKVCNSTFFNIYIYMGFENNETFKCLWQLTNIFHVGKTHNNTGYKVFSVPSEQYHGDGWYQINQVLFYGF